MPVLGVSLSVFYASLFSVPSSCRKVLSFDDQGGILLKNLRQGRQSLQFHKMIPSVQNVYKTICIKNSLINMSFINLVAGL